MGYHEAQLADLAEHVGSAVDPFRAGEHDASEVDQVIFQYSRAAKELWKFCSVGNVEITGRFIAMTSVDSVLADSLGRGFEPPPAPPRPFGLGVPSPER